MSDSATIVQKLWNYCNVLRDDGLSYQDYLEQLTFLLFLKMADEQTKPPFSRPTIVPTGLDWESVVRLDGDSLEVQYRHVLTELGKYPGMPEDHRVLQSLALLERALVERGNPTDAARSSVAAISKGLTDSCGTR